MMPSTRRSEKRTLTGMKTGCRDALEDLAMVLAIVGAAVIVFWLHRC